MTKEQFDNTELKKGMMCIYDGIRYNIVGVDFEDYILKISYIDNQYIWVLCENIVLCNSEINLQSY